MKEGDIVISPEIFWIIALIVFLLFEIITLGLTSIWFAVGALAALIAALLHANVTVQVIIFLVVSIMFILVLRPFSRKYFNKTREKTNVDALIGRRGFVTVDINNLKGEGEVNFSGQFWSARSFDDSIIVKDTEVEIVSIEGVKAIVKQIDC